MSLWRCEALARFPELRQEIAMAEGPYFVWPALWQALFLPTYEQEPPDRETAARVYEYAAWSLRQRSSQVRKAVAGEFYERLADDPRTSRDMPRWISQDFEWMKFAWDHLTPQNYAALRREFTANKARINNEEKTRRPRSSGGRSEE